MTKVIEYKINKYRNTLQVDSFYAFFLTLFQQNNVPKVSLINNSRNRQIGMCLVITGRNLLVSCLVASSKLAGLRHKLYNLTVEPLPGVMSVLSYTMCRDERVSSQTQQSGLTGEPLHRLCQHQVNLVAPKIVHFISCVEITFPPFLTCCLSVDLKGSWGLQKPPSANALGGSLQPSDLRLLSDTPCLPWSTLLLS